MGVLLLAVYIPIIDLSYAQVTECVHVEKTNEKS